MAPFIRIFLRYVTVPLLALGWIVPEEQAALIADPDVVGWVSAALGLIAPTVAEGWYWIARQLGWKT